MAHPRWVVARESEALDHETRGDSADPRREEGADDSAGEAIRDEDREVPDRDADHRPDEDAHVTRAWRWSRRAGMGPRLQPEPVLARDRQHDGLVRPWERTPRRAKLDLDVTPLLWPARRIRVRPGAAGNGCRSSRTDPVR